MKYLKLFESYSIEWDDFPYYGHELSKREKSILEELVGESIGYILKDDGYYYIRMYNTKYGYGYIANRFDKFKDLKDYIFLHYIMDVNSYFSGKKYKNVPEKFLEILKTTNLDMSFDENWAIKWACEDGHIEVVKKLLEDPNVDPCAGDNEPINLAYINEHPEIVKLLLDDPRVYYSLEESSSYLLNDYYSYIAQYGYYI